MPEPLQSSNPLIYCIGDSHSSFFSGVDRMQPKWPAQAEACLSLFKVFRIGPSLAYNLAIEGSRTKGRERLFEVLDTEVPKGSYVMLIFGEIDCRAHVINQAAKRSITIEEVVHSIVEAYSGVIDEVEALGYKVIVYNVIPSKRKPPAKSSRDVDHVAVGTCLERNRITKLFNRYLCDHCEQNEIHFLDVFDSLVDSKELTDTWYYLDSIHLSQRAMPIVLDRISKMLPGCVVPDSKVVAPTVIDRLADRMNRKIKMLRR